MRVTCCLVAQRKIHRTPMRKIIVTLLCLTALVNVLLAQDHIILRKGSEIKAKVVEITLDEIKYKKADNPDGPVYTVLKSDVFMIKYENGSKDTFSNSESKIPVAPGNTENRPRDDRRRDDRHRDDRHRDDRHRDDRRSSRQEPDPNHLATKRIVGGSVMVGIGAPAFVTGVTLTTLSALDMRSANTRTFFDSFFDPPLLATGIVLTVGGALLTTFGSIKLHKGLTYRRGSGPSFGFAPIQNPGLDRYNHGLSGKTIGAVTLTF